MSIPAIDLNQFPDSDEYKKLREASEEWGCFRLVNHKIPLTLMSEMKTVVRSLLDLPREVKKNNTDVIASSGYMLPAKSTLFMKLWVSMTWDHLRLSTPFALSWMLLPTKGMEQWEDVQCEAQSAMQRSLHSGVDCDISFGTKGESCGSRAMQEFVDSEHPRLYVPFTYDEYRKLRLSTKLQSGEALALVRIKS